MKTDSEIKDRLYSLAEGLGLNPSQFSAKIGKDRTYLSNIKKEIQSDVLRNIYIAFPKANLSWIITGDGKMFLTDEKKQESEVLDELKIVRRNYEDIKKERDEWYFKARKYEEELQKYRSSVKSDEAV